MEEKTTFENIVPKMKELKNHIEGLMKEIELETTSGKEKAAIYSRMLKLQTRLNNHQDKYDRWWDAQNEETSDV